MVSEGAAQEKAHASGLANFLSHLHPVAICFGFLGGIAPSVLKLATECVASGEGIDMPKISFFVGVAIFGLIGASISTSFKQYAPHEAFISGIVAPSLVANLVAGAQEGNLKKPIKIGLQFPSFLGEARAETPATGAAKGSGSKLSVEWDFKRKDVPVGRVRVNFWKDVNDIGTRKVLYVVPTADSIPVPAEYRYVSIEDAPPMKIPSGVSQLVVHGDVRTSLTNDFWWALGGQRMYKITNPTADFLPVSPM